MRLRTCFVKWQGYLDRPGIVNICLAALYYFLRIRNITIRKCSLKLYLLSYFVKGKRFYTQSSVRFMKITFTVTKQTYRKLCYSGDSQGIDALSKMISYRNQVILSEFEWGLKRAKSYKALYIISDSLVPICFTQNLKHMGSGLSAGPRSTVDNMSDSKVRSHGFDARAGH